MCKEVTGLLGNSALFIGKKGQRPLEAVPTVPDISGRRSTYQRAAPRGVCDGQDRDRNRDLVALRESGGEELCNRIVNGDYKTTIKNKDTDKEEVIPYEKYEESHKKMISKDDEAKMVYTMLYLKRNMKEYSCVKLLRMFARKVSSDKEESCPGSDEEYAMAVRDFKKLFRRRGKFVRQPYDDKKNIRKMKEEKKGKEERRFFKCGDPNHFISDCSKHTFNDQKAFVRGCWSESEEENDSKKD
nr:zf-CCHC domain-containing protein/UBN2 domain-containing protein [Tanacetum cinerariifolium]